MTNAIWLIAGGPMQFIAAKKIKELGYHLIISDGSAEPFCKPLADTFIQVDTFAVEPHLAAAERLRTSLKVCAVLTTAADCHGTVARLAQHLGLPHIDPEISDICRDKTKTRDLLRKAGLLQPQSHRANTYAQALDILARTSSSYVIKATDNSGSRGFAVIDAAIGLSEDQFNESLRMGTTGSVILEERLISYDGQISEASAETVWQNGKMYWINWVDRIFPRDLRFFPQIKMSQKPAEGIEIGHINPARHDFSVKQQVMQDIEVAGRSLGMHRQKGAHILKADLFFSKQGPVILEMTPRTSGGWDSSGSSMARGADIPGGVIQLALGKELDLQTWNQFFNYKDSERTVAVMSTIPDQAKDCVGRQFALASGYGSIDQIIEEALSKVQKGEYLVPLR